MLICVVNARTAVGAPNNHVSLARRFLHGSGWFLPWKLWENRNLVQELPLRIIGCLNGGNGMQGDRQIAAELAHVNLAGES